MSAAGPRLILAPISVGELIDKITILEVKARRIEDPEKRGNVERELAALSRLRDDQALPPEVGPLADALGEVNGRLWGIEDDLRALEAAGRFDDGFVALARSVYRENDVRAALKKQINFLANSAIVEEKSYFGPKR